MSKKFSHISASLMAAALALQSPTLHAAPASASDSEQAHARELYAAGLKDLQEGHPEQALAELDESAKALPSPNTDLLRAHALRALGRRVEAMQTYEGVVREAGSRVRSGDERFDSTLADAGRWIAFLRNEIGELAIEIRATGPKLSVTVDDRPVQTVYDASTGVARARLWREPGPAKIHVRGNTGIERDKRLEVRAGATEPVSFDVVRPPKVGPRPEPDHGPPVASWVAFGVGAAGLVVFAVAGGLARVKFSELDECRPHCTKDQTDDASTKATIANAGLVIGIAGVLTGGGIWLTSELIRPKPEKTGFSGGVRFQSSGAAFSLAHAF